MRIHFATLVTTLIAVTAMPSGGVAQEDRGGSASANRVVTETECAAPSLVATIAPSAIGEPVTERDAPGRVGRGHRDSAGALPHRRCVRAGRHRADGARHQLPGDPAGVWNRRGAQMGGGGINGIVPPVAGGEFGAGGPSLLQRGFATYGSDSGHQMPAFGRRGGPPPAPADRLGAE